jgi:RNA polymerase sigma factor (sigma-70 family)
MADEIQLLREYATTRSQPAFSRLVELYVGLVYSAARRQCRGDAHLAEDVTQAVFIILAEKAAAVPADRPLSAWLLRTTSYCAANARRSKSHREHYERKAAHMARMNEPASGDESAWDDLAPMLDEGMNRLRPQDRDALLLKFFEKKSIRQIGEALGISEEAAGKRVARAVERLRDFFRRRGVAVSAAALPVLLMTNAAQAAPAGMISAVVATSAGTATAAAATTTTSSAAAAVAKGALAVMAVEKAKAIALAAAAVILGVGASAVVIKTIVKPVTRGNRTVAVAPQPAAQPANGQTTVNNAWPIRFPDGTVVEVLGLCEPNAAEPMRSQWWTLDGSQIPPPAERPAMSLVTINPAPGARTILVLLRFPSGAGGASRSVALRPNIGGSTTHTSDFAGAGGVTQYVTNVPEDQKIADLVIGLAAGAGETGATSGANAARSGVRGGALRPLVYVQAQNVSLRPAERTSVRVPELRAPASSSAAAR